MSKMMLNLRDREMARLVAEEVANQLRMILSERDAAYTAWRATQEPDA